MEKHLNKLLILVVVLLVGSTIFIQSEPTDRLPLLVQFEQNDDPQVNQQFQTAITRIKKAALNGQWASALHEVERLENNWQRTKPRIGLRVNSTTKKIDDLIQILHFNVWGRDKEGVFQTSDKLTKTLNQYWAEERE